MLRTNKVLHRPIDDAGETQPKNESEINIRQKNREYEKSVHSRT